jgi:hypothetical protein
MANTRRRELTTGEAAILAVIQREFGSQNTADQVFFTDVDEAVIFAKAMDGTSAPIANLTNLAAWRADGTIASDDELRTKWLRTI